MTTQTNVTNAGLANALVAVKDALRLIPVRYLGSEDLNVHKETLGEAARRLGDPLQGCTQRHACDSLKEMVAARDREIGLLKRKLAEAVKALETVASLNCQKKCTILQRGNAADCLNCNSVHAHGALTRIQEMT